MASTFTIGAFAIIFDEHGRVLLCHRRDLDYWNLPGGAVEPGEMPDEAAVRATREETGLEVAVERLVGVYGKVGRDEFVFAFACRVTGGALAVTAEADECRYFAPAALPANTLPKHVGRIHDALRGEPGAIVRRQIEPSVRG